VDTDNTNDCGHLKTIVGYPGMMAKENDFELKFDEIGCWSELKLEIVEK